MYTWYYRCFSFFFIFRDYKIDSIERKGENTTIQQLLLTLQRQENKNLKHQIKRKKANNLGISKIKAYKPST